MPPKQKKTNEDTDFTRISSSSLSKHQKKLKRKQLAKITNELLTIPCTETDCNIDRDFAGINSLATHVKTLHVGSVICPNKTCYKVSGHYKEVTVLDPVGAIRHVYTLSMLQDVADLNLSRRHGDVLFKVYIVGETIKVVPCFSQPDVSRNEWSIIGVYCFPKASSAAASADNAFPDPDIAEIPPRPVEEKPAKELRRLLGINFFNKDTIGEHGNRYEFYVIDINYVPASADNADMDPDIAELPPWTLLEKLVKELPRLLGINFFNKDIIAEHGNKDQF